MGIFVTDKIISMYRYIRQIWKIFIILLAIFFGIHFLKDIFQDVLGLSNPILDRLDIKESTFGLSNFTLCLYYGGWIIATLLQPVFILLTVKSCKSRKFSKHDSWLILIITLFILMLAWSLILSQRARIM